MLIHHFKPLLLGFALTLPSLTMSNVAMADTFPCSMGNSCQTAPSKSISAEGGQTINWDRKSNNYDYLNGLALNDDQRSALSEMLDKQMPAIYSNIHSLENARALLRDMALSKQYDEAIAKIATERIANSTATLAVLQAEREYQIFALLTPEQTKLYEKLKAKGEIKLM